MSLSHIGVTCNICNRSLHGIRYKCLRCSNFDLCQNCHDNSNINMGRHRVTHPFQALLDGPTLRIHFGRHANRMTKHADSFTCPSCGKMGFSDCDLVRHANHFHATETQLVICPICVAVPDANPSRVPNLAAHLRLLHSHPFHQHHAEFPRSRRSGAGSVHLNRRIHFGNAISQQTAMERIEMFLSDFQYDDNNNNLDGNGDGDDSNDDYIA